MPAAHACGAKIMKIWIELTPLTAIGVIMTILLNTLSSYTPNWWAYIIIFCLIFRIEGKKIL